MLELPSHLHTMVVYFPNSPFYYSFRIRYIESNHRDELVGILYSKCGK